MNCSIDDAVQKLIIFFFSLPTFKTTAWNHSFLPLDQIGGRCHSFSQSFQSSEHSHLSSVRNSMQCKIKTNSCGSFWNYSSLPAGKLQWWRETYFVNSFFSFSLPYSPPTFLTLWELGLVRESVRKKNTVLWSWESYNFWRVPSW